MMPVQIADHLIRWRLGRGAKSLEGTNPAGGQADSRSLADAPGFVGCARSMFRLCLDRSADRGQQS